MRRLPPTSAFRAGASRLGLIRRSKSSVGVKNEPFASSTFRSNNNLYTVPPTYPLHNGPNIADSVQRLHSTATVSIELSNPEVEAATNIDVDPQIESSAAEVSSISTSSTPNEFERSKALRLYNDLIFLPKTTPLTPAHLNAVESCLSILCRLPPIPSQKLHSRDVLQNNPEAPAHMAQRFIQKLKTHKVKITGQMFEYAIQTMAKQKYMAWDAAILLDQFIQNWERRELQARKDSNSDGNGSTNEKSFQRRRGNTYKPPNSILLTSVLDALAKDHHHASAQKAEDLLGQMANLHRKFADDNGWSYFAPNTICFTAAIDAWSRLGEFEKAETLLEKMQTLAALQSADDMDIIEKHDMSMDDADSYGERGYGPMIVKPNVATYNVLLSSLSRASTNAYNKGSHSSPMTKGGRDAAELAEEILHRMKEAENIEPDAYSYGAVLKVWANAASTTDARGAERADGLLLQMERVVDDMVEDGNIPAEPITTVVCYNTVLHAWANAGDPIKAEEVLCRMAERHDRNPEICPSPNVASFNTTLLAWARSNRSDAGEKAQHLLEAMEGMTSALEETGKERQGVSSLIRTDIISFNTVLDAFLRSGTVEGALSAEYLLQSMERGERTVRPDRISYNTVIAAYAKAADKIYWNKRGGSEKYGNLNVAQKAEDILHKMIEAGVLPDTITYNTCISTWSKSRRGKEAADRAEGLLSEMIKQRHKTNGNVEQIRPDNFTYSSVMDAIARSGVDDAPYRAHGVFSWMKVRPNTYCLNTLINCWAKSAHKIEEAAFEADSILQRMVKGDDKLPPPDYLTYCTVINAWSRSFRPDKASRAKNVLDQMMLSKNRSPRSRKSAEQIRNAHNMVLNCCAYTPRHASQQDRENAVDVALKTYQDLHLSEEAAQPDEMTYANFLRVCAHLLPPGSKEREELVDVVMKDCIQRRLVTDLVRTLLDRATSGKQRGKYAVFLQPERRQLRKKGAVSTT